MFYFLSFFCFPWHLKYFWDDFFLLQIYYRSEILATLFVVLITILTPSNAADINAECIYSISPNLFLYDHVLTCTIKSLTTNAPGDIITKVNGAFPTKTSGEYTNADVKHLIISVETLTNIPSGFASQFNNLEGIQINGTKLTTLTKENLKDFNNLKYLDAGHNLIAT